MIRYLALPLTFVALLILTACSGEPAIPLNKTWTLVPAQSQITLFVVKNDSVGENFLLRPVSGSVSADGPAIVNVPLASISTGIEKRDERMQNFLFESAQFPTLKIKTFILPKEVDAFQDGAQQVTFKQDVTVSMHGVERAFTVHFVITRVGPQTVEVRPEHPVAVSAEDFHMQAGVDKLKELAGLNSITPVVGVDFSLQFTVPAK